MLAYQQVQIQGGGTLWELNPNPPSQQEHLGRTCTSAAAVGRSPPAGKCWIRPCIRANRNKRHTRFKVKVVITRSKTKRNKRAN